MTPLQAMERLLADIAACPLIAAPRAGQLRELRDRLHFLRIFGAPPGSGGSGGSPWAGER